MTARYDRAYKLTAEYLGKQPNTFYRITGAFATRDEEATTATSS